MTQHNQDDVWFVYDGKCPMCNGAANAFAIKKTLGTLHLIDARTQPNHHVMLEIKQRHLNIDDGMVIKCHHHFYHGADALHMMALIGTNSGLFNRINYALFRSKYMAKIAYPFLRFMRNVVLKLSGIHKINASGDTNINS